MVDHLFCMVKIKIVRIQLLYALCRPAAVIILIYSRSILLFILVLAVVGYAYERYASARDLKLYLPAGQLIEVNHHKMHIDCTGTGPTTVVLESQANSSSFDWGLVQPEIDPLARVCSYDRAGFGWSASGPSPRSAQQSADDLYALLNEAGEHGPYILVGASYGGHVVRIFAHDHPDVVSGVVLVDARPEKLYSIPEIKQQSQASLRVLRIISFLGDFGLTRIFIATMPEKMVPAGALPYYKAHPGSLEIVFQSKLWHASYDEAEAADLSDAQVAAIGSLGNMPLIVIRHGKSMFGSLPSQDAEAMEQKWQAFQEEMAKQSTASQIMVAEESGHTIQFDQLAIIVEAVRQVLGNP